MVKEFALNTYKITSSTKSGTDRRIAKSIPKFLFDLVAHTRSMDVFLDWIKGRQTELGASLGNEHLILSHMTG